ncbi:MAG: hypothetical protein COB69_10250 [Phycisphaera sp.]|nr:MAG: hypothetical protein COB69_10250 [Phycisphaera sp.]
MPSRNRYGAPFSSVVRSGDILDLCSELGISYRSRIFDPASTIYTWMNRTVSQDHSCRQAVSRVSAYHAAQGQSVSVSTGAYTQARQRLSTDLIVGLAKKLARELEDECIGHSPLNRPIFFVDGSGLSAPDTESNQEAFPRMKWTKPDLGFPTLRVVFMTSLTTGAVIDLRMAPQYGKGTGENTLFLNMFDTLRLGDVVVGDRAYESYWHRHLLRELGVDSVFRAKTRLDPHCPRLETLGRGDWLVEQTRPRNKPLWVNKLSDFPPRASVRIASLRLGVGKYLYLRSTLREGTRGDLLSLYERRWDIETDILALKVSLGMEILRCKTAEMLEKEAWVSILTYNAIRVLMARAAARAGVQPRELSYKGAMQTITAYGPRMDLAGERDAEKLMNHMLDAIACHKVRNRPGRAEPRLTKRRRKEIQLLMVPRSVARSRLRNGRYQDK